MSFQIRKIAVYSRQGELREMELRQGALNIITGASKTGKSTLMDIIDYCMGSSDFPVAAGVVRATVAAYAVLFQRGDEGLLVARFAPQPGRAVSTQFHLRTMAPDGSLPAIEELTITSDVETAKSALADLAGIGENLHEPTSGTRLPLRATIRHALFYCFQAQDEIASRNVLFHSQAGEYTRQAMRDVMPYFLGAVPDDHVANVNRLRQIRRDLKQLLRATEERDLVSGATGREQALIAEAVAVGLSTRSDEDDLLPVEFLRKALAAPEPTIDLPPQSAFSELTSRRRALRQDFARARTSLENLRLLAAERSEFADEAGEQRSRLSLSLLFADNRGDRCLVCDSEIVDGDVQAELRQELENLERDITAVSATSPGIDQLVAAAEAQLSELNSALRENRTALDDLHQNDQILAQFEDAALRRAATRGRISLFLSSQPDLVVDEAVGTRIRELEAEIERLEAEIDSENVAVRLDSALSRVNAAITEIAAVLMLEHSASPARLDIRRLTVIADTLNGPVPLEIMGSGENWVGYHLATMLALHRFFVEAGRPVPRFLVLDQPSQVYFPPDVDDADLQSDEDREGLSRMLVAALNEVRRAEGNLQIVVVDHADISESWFQDSVVERWRNGPALIPASWIDAS